MDPFHKCLHAGVNWNAEYLLNRWTNIFTIHLLKVKNVVIEFADLQKVK